MSLPRLYRRTFNKTLKVYWWRYEYPNKLNFGDELTPYLIERLFGLKTVWAEPKDCDIAGAGSVIEILQELSNGNNVRVWGSGFIKPGDKNSMSNFHFSAVRGKLSRDRVSGKDVALGDPGLLMPLVFSPPKMNRYKLGIVPHYIDQELLEFKKIRSKQNVKIINVLEPVEKVVRDIVSCDLILSSSLHGLIISDAYNVPNYWMPFSDLLTGGDYKFRDYYSIFDEKPKPVSPDKLASINIDTLIMDYKPKLHIKEIQNNLIKAFPY